MLSPPELFGIADSKAKQIIGSAMNVIAEENVRDIKISHMEICLKLRSVNRAIVYSVCCALGARADVCSIRQESEKITFFIKGGKKKAFAEIAKKANYLNNYLDSKIKRLMQEEGITLPHKDIVDYAKENRFEGFYTDLFSDITGNEQLKKSLAVSLFSTFDEPVHVLVLGDPGSAKTLARDILIKNMSGINSIGANATKAGLVCNLANGDPGALAVSDKKVVLIDEFDKINKSDLEYCYEILSNGRCSVHSARVHKDIISRIILIAFGNPRSNVFSNDMPMDDIGMERTLLSRFALIIRTEMLNTSEKQKLFKDKLYSKHKQTEKMEILDQWVKLARKSEPNIKVSENRSDQIIRELVSLVEKHINTQLRRDLRMGDYLRRVALALARSEFTDVTDETVEKAYGFISETICDWEPHLGDLGFLD